MNPKTQSETAKTYHSERVKRVAYAWADPLERPAGRVFSKEGLLLAALSELERELTALPGDAKERLKLEKSRTSTHAHKGCDPTCQECT
jgi:hypothetical protein